MAWTFSAYKNSDPSKTIDDVQEELDGLAFNDKDSNLNAVSAKVALSNRKSGKSFGVVFFNNEVELQTPPTGGVKFLEKTFSVKKDDPEPLYQQVRDQLNAISDREAFWAQVGLTDRQSGDTVITVYWPIEQS